MFMCETVCGTRRDEMRNVHEYTRRSRCGAGATQIAGRILEAMRSTHREIQEYQSGG
jgi:hypothetical protein